MMVLRASCLLSAGHTSISSTILVSAGFDLSALHELKRLCTDLPGDARFAFLASAAAGLTVGDLLRLSSALRSLHSQ
jgi:hypothetical protein